MLLALLLVMISRFALGLGYNSPLPWYAITLYPALILFPLAAYTSALVTALLRYRLNFSFFLAGASAFLLADIFFIDNIYPITLALGIFFGAAFFMIFYHPRRIARFIYALAGALIIYGLFSFPPDKIHFSIRSLDREPYSEYLGGKITSYGEAALHKVDKESYRLSLNHTLLFTQDEKGEEIEELIHLTMLQYPWAERVLIIGHWGRALEELLRYPDIRSIYWASPVPELHSFLNDFMPLNIPEVDKVRILRGSEGRNFIDRFREENFFDVAIIALPDPVNIFFNRYYTYHFFRELRQSAANHSLTALRLRSGGRRRSPNEQILSAAVFRSLREFFPNTFQTYSKRPLILSSPERGFTTSTRALGEYLKTLENPPGHITPSLLNYRMRPPEDMHRFIDIPGSTLNTDLKPASLKYSFNEMIYSFGLWRGLLVEMTENVDPLIVYLIFFAALIAALAAFRKKTDFFKASTTFGFSAFILFFFIWNTAALLHSGSGKLYSHISLVALGGCAAFFLLLKLTGIKREAASYSRTSRFLLPAALFFIMLTVFFEISFSPPSPPAAFFMVLAGSFLIGGAGICAFISAFQINSSEKIAAKPVTLAYPIIGASAAAGLSIFILPIMGLVEVFPLNIILILSLLFFLNS